MKARQDNALLAEIESGQVDPEDIGRVQRSAEAAEAFASAVLGKRRNAT